VDNTNELTFLNNFSKYTKLTKSEELLDHIGQSNVVDYKPKLASMLGKDLFLDNLNHKLSIDSNPALEVIKVMGLEATSDWSSEEKLIVRTMTGLIFEKWDPEVVETEDHVVVDMIGNIRREQKFFDNEQPVLGFYKHILEEDTNLKEVFDISEFLDILPTDMNHKFTLD
jgi:hypothetical protein